MKLNPKLHKTKRWFGEHDGVKYEIDNWEREYDGYDCWTYYIYLFIGRIPKDYKSFWLRGRRSGSMIVYNYYKHPIINELDFHGGCTWYSKESGFDGDRKTIKIGCDYSHLWDENRYYTLESVPDDVLRTIEKFRELVPDYKYWCCGNGKLYDRKDGVIKGDQFCSKEYYGNEDWFIELEQSQNDD